MENNEIYNKNLVELGNVGNLSCPEVDDKKPSEFWTMTTAKATEYNA